MTKIGNFTIQARSIVATVCCVVLEKWLSTDHDTTILQQIILHFLTTTGVNGITQFYRQCQRQLLLILLSYLNKSVGTSVNSNLQEF